MRPFFPQQGLRALEEILQQDYTQVGVMPVNWRQLQQRQGEGTTPPVLARFMREEIDPHSQQGVGSPP
jgi:hypothetical protein